MEAYTEFASVYEKFMDNVPYEKWCEAICEILRSHEIEDGGAGIGDAEPER